MCRRFPQLYLKAGAAILLLLCATVPAHARAARDADWMSVRSRNYTVAGQVAEKDLLRIAARLERYRAVFSRLLPEEHFDRTVPTLVIIFRDDESYGPFKPIYRGRVETSVAGYFQPGAEVNYITLTHDAGERDGGSTLLHEYVHLLVNNYFRTAPLWLKEGLAEFYSTARLSGDGRKVTLGEAPWQRLRVLRRSPSLVPLAELFAVDQQSPHYADADKRPLYYAESWALVHYMLGGSRRAQFSRFLDLLAGGSTVERALAETFGADVRGLEAELSSYVRASRYPERTEVLAEAPAFDASAQARTLARAEVLTLLGGLLLRSERADESEAYLVKAVETDPASGAALDALGLLRLRQNRFDEACDLLRRAVEADPRNHLAHYHYADALRHAVSVDEQAAPSAVRAFEERTALVRASLLRSIELAPEFIEPYKLLAMLENERGEGPEASIRLLRRALEIAPRRRELTLMLAQAQLSKGDFSEARRLAEEVARLSGDPRQREFARTLLTQVETRAEAAARLKSQEDAAAARPEASLPATPQPCDMPAAGPQHKRLRFSGEQVCGRLTQIECEGGRIVLHVESGGRALRLTAEALNRVRFITYTAAVKTGQLTCGPRDLSAPVLVTYRPRKDALSPFDGEAEAVEFVPEDWKHE
ncbi:MAG TPA: tetratricopeptide repeat protein [Pyrinomonadaceae bacterium]|jgi:tetratricopeptide (TPR) repeat protein|nr:tetratricopeptide repeat protein [Pyrinomonadaceae bacterium]